jgi:hypothetical protein
MSVDIHGGSSGDPEDPGEALPEAPRASRQPTALQRVAGAIPEETRVEQSLEQFIAQVHSSLAEVSGWSQTEEQAAREREDAARREEEARRSALTKAEAARAAADTARRAAEADATRARALERRTSERVVALEARLAEAENRAAEAEKRALRVPPLLHMRTERMRSIRPVLPIFASAAVVGAAAVAVILFWRGGAGIGEEAADPPGSKVVAPAAYPPHAAPPEPVVRSMLPAEPSVTPLEEKQGADQRPARPPRRNPGPDAHVRPQGPRATPIDSTTRPK